MVRDASLRDAPHHEVFKTRGRPTHKTRRPLPATQVGLPDLRIKKPISGKPEIGAQFRLWIFSYHVFGVPAKIRLSRINMSRQRGIVWSPPRRLFGGGLARVQATLPALRGWDRSRAICAAGCGAPNR